MAGSIKITVTADPGNTLSLSDATVEVNGPVGASMSQPLTWIAAGVAVTGDLVPGDYVVTPKNAPPGSTWAPDATEATVPVADDGAATKSFAVKAVAIKIVVGGPSVPAPAPIRFTVTGGPSLQEVEVAGMEQLVPVPSAGTYVVTQTTCREGQTEPPKPPEPQEITVNAATPAPSVTFTQKAVTIHVKVVEATDTTKALGGCGFTVKNEAGARVYEGQTGTDGMQTVTLPRPGAYVVGLSTPAPGHAFVGPESQKVTAVWGDGDASPPALDVVFTNAAVNAVADHRVAQLWSGAIVTVGGLVTLALALGFERHLKLVPTRFHWYREQWALSAAWATGVLTAGLALAAVAGRSGRGMFDALVGSDNRTSTSRFAPALWTVSLVWVITYIAADSGWSSTVLVDRLPQDRWGDYLVLLGGPFAAFAIARGVVARQVNNGTVQKVESTSSPTVSQLVQGDEGGTSLTDTQYLLFNAVALVFFWKSFANGGVTLPVMPAVLLSLTSGAAALYTANKVANQNAPAINSIEPAAARAGDEVRIGGRNFRPAGSADTDHVSVSLSDVGTLAVTFETDTEVRVVVPATAPAGARNLTVTSTAKISTEPMAVQILTDVPEVAGAREGAVTKGGPLTLLGRNFRSALDPAATTALVAFGERWVLAEIVADTGADAELTVTAPDDLDGTQVAVRVRSTLGGTSLPITLPIV